MGRLFSEMVRDEAYQRFGTLTDVLNELDALLYENAHLRAENKHLREMNERYVKNLQETVDNSMFNIGETLRVLTEGIDE